MKKTVNSDGIFKTPSGKYELYSNKAAKMGIPPLPVYSEPAESIRGESGMGQKYPFHLLSPAHARSIHSQYYRNVEPGEFPVVHLGTGPAEEKGIKEGSLVEVTSLRGSLVGIASLHDHFRHDVVLILW